MVTFYQSYSRLRYSELIESHILPNADTYAFNEKKILYNVRLLFRIESIVLNLLLLKETCSTNIVMGFDHNQTPFHFDAKMKLLAKLLGRRDGLIRIPRRNRFSSDKIIMKTTQENRVIYFQEVGGFFQFTYYRISVQQIIFSFSECSKSCLSNIDLIL